MSQTLDITISSQGVPVVSSISFAEGLGIQHKNLLETIDTHQNVIESKFGAIAFETRLPIQGAGGKSTTFAQLTEEQALFVGTLSRNSKRVVEFKATLVQEFAEARRRLAASQTLPATPAELLVQMAQQILQSAQVTAELDRRTHVLEQKVERMERIQHTAEVELLALPAPTEPMADMSTEAQIVRHVNTYAQAMNMEHGNVWRKIYAELLYRYHISVNSYKLEKGETKLQRLKRLGHLDKVLIIALNILRIDPAT